MVDAGPTDAGDASADAGPTDSGWGPDAPVCDPLTSLCVVRARLPAWPGLSTDFGYMQSTGFACFQNRGWDGNSAEIAVGPDGVYVLAASYQAWPMGLDQHAPGYTLLRNSGTGWETLAAQRFLDGGSTANDLAVMPDGTVYAGFGIGPSACGLQRLYPGDPACISSSTSALDSSPLPRRLHALDARLFGLEDTGISELVDGGLTPLISFPAITGTPYDFWTDGTDMVVTGTDALLLRRSGGTTAQVPNTPADTYWTVVAASADDFRVISSTAVQHFTGGTLQADQAPPTLCGVSERLRRGAIGGLTLYYLTDSQFGRIGSAGYEPIFDIPCSANYRFDDLDIRASDGMVFLSVVGEQEVGTTCGGTHLLWYDGLELQEF